MRKLMYCFVALILIGGCTKETKQPSGPDSGLESKQEPASVKADDWVWVGNQATKQIEIYNPSDTNWDDSGSLIFWFKPLSGNGYTPYALDNWNHPNDFKVRNNSYWGGNTLVACASKGLVTVATYPGKVKKWAHAVGTNIHPHGVELLPSGHVAVACTDVHQVRVYMAAKPGVTDNNVYASFPLNGAHAVMWDPNTSTLRAIGNDYIVSLVVGGTVDNPTLTEVSNGSTRGALVAGGASLWGHDLAVDLNDTNILWCTTNSGVYKFDKTTRQFTGAPGGVNKTFVKGISRQSSGIFVLTRQDAAKSPQPSDPVTDPNWSWCTRYVDFYSASGTFLYYRHRSGAMFYRGKIFRTPY